MNKKRPLILCEPSGGLCNRMRALASAISLAQDAGAVLRIIWKSDIHLSCRFDTLFMRPVDVASIYNAADSLSYRVANHAICTLARKRLEQHEVEAMVQRGDDFLPLAKVGRLFVRTHSSFYRGGDVTLLQPVPEILDSVEGYQLDRARTVGVHIRRTDNDIATQYSPTELFISLMQKEIKQDSETIFFLATDSPDEESRMRQIFPGRIVSHSKTSFERTEPRAIRDAMVDLYALAKCRCLIGSYRSSFTDAAAAIGRMPLEVVRGQDGKHV